MKSIPSFRRTWRWVHVVLFALAPVLSAGICDCCERGNCSERCPPRELTVAGCCEATEGKASSCCSALTDVPVSGCGSVGEGVASDTCRCMREPKELWSGSKDHDSLLPSTATPLASVIHPAVNGLWDDTARTPPVTVAVLCSFIPRRSVRVLYAVWRN